MCFKGFVGLRISDKGLWTIYGLCTIWTYFLSIMSYKINIFKHLPEKIPECLIPGCFSFSHAITLIPEVHSPWKSSRELVDHVYSLASYTQEWAVKNTFIWRCCTFALGLERGIFAILCSEGQSGSLEQRAMLQGHAISVTVDVICTYQSPPTPRHRPELQELIPSLPG